MAYPGQPLDQRMLRGVSAHWQALVSFFDYIWTKSDLRLKSFTLLTFLFMFIGELLSGVVPIIYKVLTDDLTESSSVKGSSLFFSVAISFLMLILGIGSLRLLQVLFKESSSILFNGVRVEATRKLAVEVFEHLHSLSMKFHLGRRTGGLSRIIERGIRSIEFLLTFILLNTMPLVLQLTISLVLLSIYFGFEVSLLVFLTLLFYGWFTFKVSEWRMKLRREMNNLDTDANAKAIDSLMNFETVRYFTNEQYEVSRFDSAMRLYNASQLTVSRSLSFLNIGQTFIIVCSLVLITSIVVFGVLRGEKTIGDFVMLNMYLLPAFAQLGFLGTVYRQIRQSLTDMEDLFSILRESVEIEDLPEADDLCLTEGGISFDNVSFSYDVDRRILHNLQLEISGCSKVAVVGPSGSGKTTLSRLLLRFYELDEGRIQVDGIDIRDVTQRSLRERIGIVPQDTILFNGTICENIGYGRTGASREEVLEAAKAARLGELLEQLPKGLDTEVGERGLKLSGGERQRVAIARILLRNPPIVIFDEATASLDTATEQAIMESLSLLAEGRTTLMIAHRLATVVEADRIIVLDNGLIVEEGTHEQLVDRGGLYAGMWKAQRGLEEIEKMQQEAGLVREKA